MRTQKPKPNVEHSSLLYSVLYYCANFCNLPLPLSSLGLLYQHTCSTTYSDQTLAVLISSHCLKQEMRSLKVLLSFLSFSVTGTWAQFLPGIDEEDKPGDPNDVEEFADCIEATIGIYKTSQLGNEIDKILVQSAPDLEECQTQGGDRVICEVDMEDFDNNMKDLCDSVSGQYNERVHQIECQAPTSAMLLYKVENYPSCYAKECMPADLERAINQEVESLERLFSDILTLPCTVDFEIEDEDGEVSFINDCPYQEQATPGMCGPLESATRQLNCDCYSFCNGELVGCDNAEPVSCSGDLVAGCTYELFGRYDVQQSGGSFQSLASVLVISQLTLLLRL
jgi:hypothetical protein